MLNIEILTVLCYILGSFAILWLDGSEHDAASLTNLRGASLEAGIFKPKHWIKMVRTWKYSCRVFDNLYWETDKCFLLFCDKSVATDSLSVICRPRSLMNKIDLTTSVSSVKPFGKDWSVFRIRHLYILGVLYYRLQLK